MSLENKLSDINKTYIDIGNKQKFELCIVPECKLSCLVTNDKAYLGQDNIDKFDALIFKIRSFRSNDRGK